MASVSPRSTSPLPKPVPYNDLRATKHPLDRSLATTSTENLFRDWADLKAASEKETAAKTTFDQKQAIQDRNQRQIDEQLMHVTPENTPGATTMRVGQTTFAVTMNSHPQSFHNPRAFQKNSSVRRLQDNKEWEQARVALEDAKKGKQAVRSRLETTATDYKALKDPNSPLSAINVARTRLAEIYNRSKGLIPRPSSPK